MLAAIVLAAGKGTRMKSQLPKVLHPVAGQPMVSCVLQAARRAGVQQAVVVYGHGGELVPQSLQATFSDLSFARQEELNGTAKAVEAALPALSADCREVLVLCGDTPLLDGQTLQDFIDVHRCSAHQVSILSAVIDEPASYGRILRDPEGQVTGIVEAKDATAQQLAIKEVNSGIYLVQRDFLQWALPRIGCDNAQGEYYLPDIVGLAVEHDKGVGAVACADYTTTMGVNSRQELAVASQVLFRRKCHELMAQGVTIIDPERTCIEYNVQVGTDTTIYPNVYLERGTEVGHNCLIRQGCTLIASRLGDNCILKDGSYLEEASVGNSVSVGPYAHLRPGSQLDEHVKIGNFVEIKKSTIGAHSKVSHLTYIGDAQVGRDVNIGCGTITCNYDGFNKYRTVLEDGVFVGSDTQLVAPVRVGQGAMVGAGTTVTEDVPADSLVLSRVRQKVIGGWAARFRHQQNEKS